MNNYSLKFQYFCFGLLIYHVQISPAQNFLVFLKTLISDSSISTDQEMVKFTLLPSADQVFYSEDIEIGNTDGLRKSNYNSSLPLKVIVHGFLSNKENDVLATLQSAYVEELYEVNIIGVDWSLLSTAKSVLPAIFYPTAAKNVAAVGKQLSVFLQFLIRNDVLQGPEDVHLIGFSLGAHICGIAGSSFLQDTGMMLHRISGLDPAGPIFQYLPEADRLDKSDANFVDITHTNMETFGFNASLGHADFYANGGGPIQPDCSRFFDRAGSCSHSDAYRYFAKSLETDIVACECPDISSSRLKGEECRRNCRKPVLYGDRCTARARGDYYMEVSVENEK